MGVRDARGGRSGDGGANATARKSTRDDDVENDAALSQVKFPKGTMPVQFLCAGGDHFLALTDDSSKNIYSWGRNNCGQLGLGHLRNMSQPTRVLFPDFHYRERATFAACGHNFCFCVTATNRVFSWGSNQNGQLAQWTSQLSGEQIHETGTIVTTPRLCHAWEKYRELNLPYNDLHEHREKFCPIRDGWRTYHRLMISCGHDHAFSWQTTDEQLKHAHGRVRDDSKKKSSESKYDRYVALCPRSQLYSSDMNKIMRKLQTVMAELHLMTIKHDKLKRSAARWRSHALHGDKGGKSGSSGMGATTTMHGDMFRQSVEQTEKYSHTSRRLKEVREKVRTAKEKGELLIRERDRLRLTLKSVEKSVNLNNRNLYELSSRIDADHRRIDEVAREINRLKQKSNESSVSDAGMLAGIEAQIRSAEKRRDALLRDQEVNVELHRFGQSNRDAKRLSGLETRLEDIENKIEHERECERMYAREAAALKGTIETMLQEAKSKAMLMSTGRSDASTTSSASERPSTRGLERVIEVAERLRSRIQRSSVRQMSLRGEVDTNPLVMSAAMLDRIEEEVSREFDVRESDLLGDVKDLLKEVLLQNCTLLRQANGMRRATRRIPSGATSDRTSNRLRFDGGDVEGGVDSDSGSDEYVT